MNKGRTSSKLFFLFGKRLNLNLTCFAHIICFSIQSKRNKKEQKVDHKNALELREHLLIFTLKH